MTKGKNYNPVLKTQCIRIPKEGMTAKILRLKDGGNCTIHKHVCIKKKSGTNSHYKDHLCFSAVKDICKIIYKIFLHFLYISETFNKINNITCSLLFLNLSQILKLAKNIKVEDTMVKKDAKST